jgi:S1-C subfamily serine protease
MIRIKLLIISFILLNTTISYSQKNNFLSGFKYAIVNPLTQDNGARDIHGIEANAISALNKLGIECLDSENIKNWPVDAQLENCLIAYVSISGGSSPNAWNCGSVKVTIYNCRAEIIEEKVIKSKNAIDNYPYNACYVKWGLAVKSYFESLNYNYDPNLYNLKTKYPEVEQSIETEESIKNYLNTNLTDPIEGIYKSYQDDELLGYYKLGIKKLGNRFIAINLESDNVIWKTGEVKAYFESASLKGVYSVQWLMGDKTKYETFGEIKDGILQIKFSNTGEKRISNFIKLYPPQDNTKIKGVESSKVSGSGFFLTEDGLLATNAHVIRDAKKIEVEISNELGVFKYNAKIELKDSNNDVAILKIDDPNFKKLNSIPYELIQKSEIGENVFTIGFPLNDIMGTNYKVTNGIISSNTGIENDVRFYQISVPLQPGNSGGPLFNKDGNIVGLTTAKLDPEAVGTNVENVNYAVKAQYLIDILNLLPSYKSPKPEFRAKGKELADQVKILKNFVCLIEVTQ